MSGRHGSGQHGWVVACGLLLTMLWAPAHACAQRSGRDPIDAERVAAVKAGMLINFVRYTTWPDDAFDDTAERAPVVITVVGGSAIESALLAAAQGQAVNGRRIEIRRLRYPSPARGESAPSEEDLEQFHDALRESHMAFFGDSELHRYPASLAAIAGASTLTVSDVSGFAEGGGMLGLAVRDGRVAFDANEAVIRESPLRVSSQVLKLARIVTTARAEPGAAAGDGGGS